MYTPRLKSGGIIIILKVTQKALRFREIDIDLINSWKKIKTIQPFKFVWSWLSGICLSKLKVNAYMSFDECICFS